MRLPNPNGNKPFDKIIKDKEGNSLYGVRAENTPDEEMVYIPTGKSNHAYYKPEVVMNPEGCKHYFILTNVGRREIECSNCNYSTSFIIGVNFFERKGTPYFKQKGKTYKIHLS